MYKEKSPHSSITHEPYCKDPKAVKNITDRFLRCQNVTGLDLIFISNSRVINFPPPSDFSAYYKQFNNCPENALGTVFRTQPSFPDLFYGISCMI